jgi:hypothetical protein
MQLNRTGFKVLLNLFDPPAEAAAQTIPLK